MQFEPLGSFARKLVQTPQALRARALAWLPARFARRPVCLATTSREQICPGCNESPLLGRGVMPLQRVTRAEAPAEAAAAAAAAGRRRHWVESCRSSWTCIASSVLPNGRRHRPHRRSCRWHRKRSTSEEGVCEMPDWKYGCRQCDARCRAEAGGWAADCKQVKDACRTVRPGDWRGWHGHQRRARGEGVRGYRNGKLTGLPSSRKWASSVKGKLDANGYGAVSKRQAVARQTVSFVTAPHLQHVQLVRTRFRWKVMPSYGLAVTSCM